MARSNIGARILIGRIDTRDMKDAIFGPDPQAGNPSPEPIQGLGSPQPCLAWREGPSLSYGAPQNKDRGAINWVYPAYC